mmetsp:Transcript_2727/g.6208  ORF Transcript_2727/g.6208 Transcript_2727/m.6208 type:complete len:265 (-) Transcript_2727:495-1289(-)
MTTMTRAQMTLAQQTSQPLSPSRMPLPSRMACAHSAHGLTLLSGRATRATNWLRNIVPSQTVAIPRPRTLPLPGVSRVAGATIIIARPRILPLLDANRVAGAPPCESYKDPGQRRRLDGPRLTCHDTRGLQSRVHPPGQSTQRKRRRHSGGRVPPPMPSNVTRPPWPPPVEESLSLNNRLVWLSKHATISTCSLDAIGTSSTKRSGTCVLKSLGYRQAAPTKPGIFQRVLATTNRLSILGVHTTRRSPQQQYLRRSQRSQQHSR